MSEFLEIEAEESENEEEGQPAKKKQRVDDKDSSSEDEEVDDEKLQEELKDFVNDEVEETTAASDSDKSDDEADDEISDDDIELMKEAGIMVKKRSRVRVESSDDEDDISRGRDALEEQLFAGGSDDEMPSAGPVSSVNVPEVEDEDVSDDSDVDDFIVDEQGQSLSQRQKKRTVLPNAALQEAQETFGVDFDFSEFQQYAESDEEERESEYEEEVEGEEGDEAARERARKKRKSKSRRSIYEVFEPSELESGFLTQKDEEIRMADMPERFQLRSIPVEIAEAEELEEEANWIYRRAFVTDPISQQRNLDYGDGNDEQEQVQPPNSSWVVKIGRVLDFMRNQFLEAAFIATYRKEYVGEDFTVTHLWKVEEWDEKWMLLKSRRQNQKKLLDRMQRYQFEKFVDVTSFPLGERPLGMDDVVRVEKADTMEDLRDLYQHFCLYYGPDLPAMRKWERAQRVADGETIKEPQMERPPQKIGGYHFFLEHGIAEVAEKFGLSAENFGKNLEQMYQVHFVEHSEVGEPDAYAQQFVDRMQNSYSQEGRTYPFNDPVALLTAARGMIAMQFAYEPRVRSHIRNQYFDLAKLNVKCTKLGFNEIDENHPCYTMRYLSFKPVRDLQGEDFVKLTQAETDKLLTIEFTIDSPDGQSYFQEILPLYQSDFASRIAQQWNQQRTMVLQKALNDLLYPMFAKELRSKLLEECEEGIIRTSASRLRKWIHMAPYPGRQEEGSHHNHQARIAAVAYSREFNEAAYCVMLDKYGEVVDFVKLDTIARRRPTVDIFKLMRLADVDKLKKFFVDKKPDVVAIASESMEALRIADDLQAILSELEDEIGTVPVEIVDNQPAIVYMNSEIDNSNVEFRKYPLLLKQAISLGRRLQNPMVELSQLCNEKKDVLFLKLHMYQDAVNKERLHQAIIHEFVNCVNEVGVDINNCIPHPHTSSILQFVCGLGPRKSAHLIKWLKRQPHQVLVNRLALISQGQKSFKMTRQIFVNCAGFIRIIAENIDTDGQDIDRLDGTRVHVEAYEWARKMAVDALEWDDADPNGAIDEIFRNPEKLRELDLDAFADELKKQGYGDRHITLYDIRAELNERFRELRKAYQPPTPEERFSMVTGETPETFYIGKMVNCRITMIFRKRPEGEQLDQANPVRNEETGFWECPFCQKNDFPELSEVWSHFDANTCEGRPIGVRCILDNGVRGFIKTNMISDSDVKNPEDRVKPAMAVNARITRIDIERFRVDLTTRSSDLRDEGERSWRPEKDTFYDREAELKDEAYHKEKKKRQEQRYMKRVIAHAQFHNIDYAATVKLMEPMDIGDAVFRPSSKGPNHLTLTWKVTDDILQHVSILEQNKTNDFSIGKTLIINEDEFEDLDEILARYVQPMAHCVREVMSYKYFISADGRSVDALNEHLYEERRKAPSKAPYGVSFSRDLPGKCLLSYLPPGKGSLKRCVRRIWAKQVKMNRKMGMCGKSRSNRKQNVKMGRLAKERDRPTD